MAVSVATLELRALLGAPSLRGRRTLAVVAFWTVIAFISATAIYLDGDTRMQSAAWSRIVLRNLVYCAFWVVVSMAVLATAQRYPLGRPLGGARLAGYLLLSAGVFALNLLWLALIWTVARGEPLDQYRVALRDTLHFRLYIDYLVFWIIVAAAHAIVYYQRYREEERDRAALALTNSDLASRLARSELDLLRAQLEPHFVFNALNSISGLVRTGEREQAVAAIARLSELLRYVVQGARQGSVPLLWEIDFIEQYVALQRLRYGERLQWEADLQSGVHSAAIPALVLQPLVENAVKYTIASGGGVVRVRARRVAARLECDVINSFTSSEPVDGCGVGLDNTRRRLQACYGADFVLATRAENGIFVTHLELPLIHDDVERE